MSDSQYWQSKLVNEIPLCQAVQLQIDQLSQTAIVISAPLANNINGHGTGFAGSIYTLSIATGWTLLSFNTTIAHLDNRVVAGQASISYHKPVTKDFFAHCRLGDDVLSHNDNYRKWREQLANGRSVKIPLKIEVREQDQMTGKAAAILNADYYIVKN